MAAANPGGVCHPRNFYPCGRLYCRPLPRSSIDRMALSRFLRDFLIIIVVIFQEELRQIFERIAVWSLATKPPRPLRSDAVDILIGTLADLAKEKIGALVVVEG